MSSPGLEDRPEVLIRWSAQLVAALVVCPAIAGSLYAVYLPASAFGHAIQDVRLGLSEALVPGAAYSVASLFIIGIPMVAASYRVRGRFLLLPRWAVQLAVSTVVIMLLLYGTLSFWSLLPLTSGDLRVDLGYNATRYLAILTSTILGVGMVLVCDGPPPAAWRVRHRKALIITLPGIPCLTVAAILGLAR